MLELEFEDDEVFLRCGGPVCDGCGAVSGAPAGPMVRERKSAVRIEGGEVVRSGGTCGRTVRWQMMMHDALLRCSNALQRGDMNIPKPAVELVPVRIVLPSTAGHAPARKKEYMRTFVFIAVRIRVRQELNVVPKCVRLGVRQGLCNMQSAFEFEKR